MKGQYLERYAEAEVRAELPSQLGGPWEHVVVVPVYREGQSFFSLLESFRNIQGKFLAILVLNENDPTLELSPDFVERLKTELPDWRPDRGLSFGRSFAGWDALVVNRASPNHYFAAEQGVGLARKIGCDLAHKFFCAGQIKSPWIRTTDADAQIGADYFSCESLVPERDTSAFVMPFKHSRDEDPRLAEGIETYERYMDSYVDGLVRAGSPYAFHSIGSTLGIHQHSYALVRGFPRRNAGEDFYILNKLAKLKPVFSLTAQQCVPLLLEGRKSRRVPFGTGAALAKMVESELGLRAYPVYDIKIFEILGKVLRAFGTFAEIGYEKFSSSTVLEKFSDHFLSQQSGQQKSESSSEINREIRRFFAESKIDAEFEKLRRLSPKSAQRLRHFHAHFDALRTLQLVRCLKKVLTPSS